MVSGLQSIAAWSCCFEPEAAQNIMARAPAGGSYSTHGSQEVEGREQAVVPYPWKGMFPGSTDPLPQALPVSYRFFQLPVAPQAGDQALSAWAFGRHLRSKL